MRSYKPLLILFSVFLLCAVFVSGNFWTPWQGLVSYNNGSSVFDADLTVNVSNSSVTVYNETFVNQIRMLPGNRSGFDVVLGVTEPFNFFYNQLYDVCFTVQNESQGCFDWKPSLGWITGGSIWNGTLNSWHFSGEALIFINDTIDARSGGGGGGGNVSDVWLNESGDTLRGELNFTDEAVLTDNSTRIFFEDGDVIVWFN